MLASGVNHGDGFPVWEVEIGGVKTKVGIEICYDIQHPEATRELALGGAEIVFNPYDTMTSPATAGAPVPNAGPRKPAVHRPR